MVELVDGRCADCGSAIDRRVTINIGAAQGEFFTCGRCFDAAREELTRYQRIHTMLTDLGLSKKNANLSVLLAMKIDQRRGDALTDKLSRVPLVRVT